MIVTITATRMPTKCPACLDHLAAGPIVVRCSECKAPHHGECLTELGCASLVCTATSAAGGNTNPFNGQPGFVPEAFLATHPNPLAEAIAEGGYYSVNYDVGIGAWSLPCVSSSDYADLMSRVNYATLEAEFGGDPCSCDLTGATCDGHPGHNTEACTFWHNGTFQVLGAPCECTTEDNEPWDCERRAVESMGSLEEYPVLDDSLHSEAECHDQDQQWDSYARADFIDELASESGLDADDVTNEQADALRHLASDATGDYPEGTDDNLSFPYQAWASYLAQQPDILREHGFTDLPPPFYDHPLGATEILTVGNSTAAKDAASKLPPGRPDTPDTRRMVVRVVYGAMGPNGRSSVARYYRRLAYRVALEFYLGQG